MKQLLGDKAATADPSFLRELFLQRLPPAVRMVLASAKEDDLDKLASLADRVAEVATPVSVIETSQLSAEVEQLRAEITDLKSLVVKSLSSTSSLPARKHTPRHRAPSRSTSPAPPTQSTGLCWYHARFAEKAARCNQLCSWDLGNEQAGH